MNATSIAAEPAARRFSPALFALAAVCFFLTFAGVSCNTGAVRSAAESAARLGGGQVPGGAAGVDACVNAFGGVNLVSYSGFNLAFGSNPSVNSSFEPDACRALGGNASVPSPASSLAASKLNVGAQPFALAAFVLIILAIVAGLFGLGGVLSAAVRSALAAAAGLAGLILLLVAQAGVHDAVINRLSAEAGPSGALVAGSVGSYFDISAGIGFILAEVVLALVVLLNVAALLVRPEGAMTPQPAEPVGPGPPTMMLPLPPPAPPPPPTPG